MSDKRLSRSEAIALLANCKSLVIKLDVCGVEVELTELDRAAIAGFTELLVDGWIDEPDINLEAKLRRTDIKVLKILASQVQAEEMRRQHASGEQLDD